jgi:hypothetical protein
MAETRISKIQIRQGNFVDLPLLDVGELGYATDKHRLYIGNNVVEVGTGDGVLDTFSIPISLSSPNNIKAAFIDGVQVNAANYSMSYTSLTFATPPALGEVITIKYNSEVEVARDISNDPVEETLPANGNQLDTGLILDTTLTNTAFLNYTLKTANGLRIGELRLSIDTDSGLTVFSDNFDQTGAVDIVFNLDSSATNTLKLQYTDNDNLQATFKYTYQLWNNS